MSYAAALWFDVWESIERDEGCSITGSVLDSFDDDFLFRTLHLTRPAIRFVIDFARVHLRCTTNRTLHDVTVLAALCFYANGFFPNGIADTLGISLESLSGAVDTVSRVFSDKLDEFITFPDSQNDRSIVAHDIQKMYGVPNVAGVLGCMHTRVKPVPGEEVLHANCMNYYSVMSQMVCDAQGNLLSVENQWPGSASQQHVWDTSKICQEFKGGRHGHSWLVGASCYNLSKHILVPLTYVNNQPGLCYNESHFKIQSIVQKTFGALKLRFRCLENLEEIKKGFLSRPAEIINACCVLHNIAKKFSVALPAELVPEPVHYNVNGDDGIQTDCDMFLFRQEMIRAYFSQDSGAVPQLLHN